MNTGLPCWFSKSNVSKVLYFKLSINLLMNLQSVTEISAQFLDSTQIQHHPASRIDIQSSKTHGDRHISRVVHIQFAKDVFGFRQTSVKPGKTGQVFHHSKSSTKTTRVSPWSGCQDLTRLPGDVSPLRKSWAQCFFSKKFLVFLCFGGMFGGFQGISETPNPTVEKRVSHRNKSFKSSVLQKLWV